MLRKTNEPGTLVKMKLPALFVALVPLVVLPVAPRNARADGLISADAGGGIARLLAPGPFFQTGDSSLGTGTALSASGALQITPVNSRVRLFFGAAYRYTTGSDDSASFALQGIYPMLRLALPGLYVSVGATPLLWGRDVATSGDGWRRRMGSVGYFSEVGIEYGLSPEASLIAAVGGQVVNSSGTLSPRPALDLTAQIRIYFFPLRPGEGAGARGSSSDFLDGWRYPFGIPKR